MADIVRNADLKKEEHEHRQTKKEVEYDDVKAKGNKGYQVTIDNYMRTQLNLMSAINMNLVTIIKLLKELKDRR